MKKMVVVTAVTALALVTAPTALAAKSFTGTVKGSGLSAKYKLQAEGSTKACITKQSGDGLETLVLKVKGESLKIPGAKKKSCRSDKAFVRALKKADSVKVTAKGPYGENPKGTLR